MTIRAGYPGKRALDLVLAVTMAVLASPMAAVVAIAVRATSRGPVLHRAVRVGRDGAPYTLFKFRSMRPDTASLGVGITVAGDARITPVGKWLRRWKLDELPQLWNVLRGDMSIVGPRPEDPRYVDAFPAHLRVVLSWRPGLTSPASIAFRHEERILAGAAGDLEAAYRAILVQKLEADVEYFQRQSLVGDLRLILRTLAAIVR